MALVFRPCDALWVLGTALLLGCPEGAATDSASPTGLGGSTGDSGDDSTSGPTSAGVTSSVPTSDTQSSNTDPSDPTIDPTDGSCQGCMNAAGICESGEFNDACGRGGSPCEVCDAPAQCAEGVCEAPPQCGPDNCDGCCDGDSCVQNPTDAACGAGGSECTECDPAATCTAGTCELPCEESCLGCCTDQGECVEDFDIDESACGLFGDACQACVGDETCDFGVCSSPSCIETCDGCCVGSTCYDGLDDSQCGYQETCDTCVAGQTCDGIDCVFDNGVVWEVTLLDGEIVSVDPAGDAWDAFGGAPDPYLIIPELGFESMVIDNTLDPVWFETIATGVSTADLQAPLTFQMRDSDVIVDQDIGVCTVSIPKSAFGNLHQVTCNVNGDFAWSVLLSIETP